MEELLALIRELQEQLGSQNLLIKKQNEQISMQIEQIDRLTEMVNTLNSRLDELTCQAAAGQPSGNEQEQSDTSSGEIEDPAEDDSERARHLMDTLENHDISAELKQVIHGPGVTRFDIQPGKDVRVKTVEGILDKIGLRLGTGKVCMEAPVPGTNYIGFEVPNARLVPVAWREVMESDEMRADSQPLTAALGKDITGTPVLCDLSKMPHLLIAGAAGSGKSVCINAIICSLISRAAPARVRLLMIDNGKNELMPFSSIPHLLAPVVTKPRKAIAALKWAVNEMFARYHRFAEAKVRNMTAYNKLKADTGEALPDIVVIVNEMAELMADYRKDVEEAVCQLSALARAAGIFMILTTQCTDEQVITPAIRNNIPSRIAFAVSGAADSRMILDIAGAEKLAGKGDMLFKPAGQQPVRVQGCFLSEDEVNYVVQSAVSGYQTVYNTNIVEAMNQTDEDARIPAPGNDDSSETLLHKAIRIAFEERQVSINCLCRDLNIGYARAGRLIDEMERMGIIARSEIVHRYKTVMTEEEYRNMSRS